MTDAPPRHLTFLPQFCPPTSSSEVLFIFLPWCSFSELISSHLHSGSSALVLPHHLIVIEATTVVLCGVSEPFVTSHASPYLTVSGCLRLIRKMTRNDRRSNTSHNDSSRASRGGESTSCYPSHSHVNSGVCAHFAPRSHVS